MQKLRIPVPKEKPKDFSKMPWTEELRTEYPARVLSKYVEGGVEIDDLRDYLFAEKLVDYRKANLLVKAYQNEQGIVRNDSEILLEIAVPICSNQCSNCDRQLYKKTHKCYKDYFENLLKEVIATRQLILKKGYFVKSVCFTGNVLVFSPEELEKLMNNCAYTLSEICIEVSDAFLITPEKLAVLKKYNNVRFILNALTFNLVTLRTINKHFEYKDIKDNVRLAVDSGFDVSARLVVGLGKERDLQLSRNIKLAIELGANCIDLYARHCPKITQKPLDDPSKIAQQRQLHEYANDYILEQNFVPYYLYCTEVDGGCFENIGFYKYKKCKFVEDRALGISTVVGCGVGAQNILVKNLYKTKKVLDTTLDLGEYITSIDDIILNKIEFFN